MIAFNLRQLFLDADKGQSGCISSLFWSGTLFGDVLGAFLLRCDYGEMCCSQIKPSSPWSCNNAPETTPLPASLLYARSVHVSWNPCVTKKALPCQDAAAWSHVSATDCAVQGLWHVLTSWVANVYYFRGEMIIRGKAFEGTCGRWCFLMFQLLSTIKCPNFASLW